MAETLSSPFRPWVSIGISREHIAGPCAFSSFLWKPVHHMGKGNILAGLGGKETWQDWLAFGAGGLAQEEVSCQSSIRWAA